MCAKLVNLLFLSLFILTSNAQNDKIIFLHHSTGGMVYHKGKVADSIEAYNQRNNSHISITERDFPDKPYPWENYPYDYWNIWVNGDCDHYKGKPEYPNVECLEDLCKKYDVIILKHCFPGSSILEDTGHPDVASKRKSLENYKLQYRALRDKFDAFPGNRFIVWTLAPLHRLEYNTPDEAARAKEFAGWVKNEWLTEDGKQRHHIHVFDYFSYTAETDRNAAPPRVPYCLKYDYELSHDNSDSHPNETACKAIGPRFAEFIIQTVIHKQP